MHSTDCNETRRTANNRSGPGVKWEETDLDRGIYLPRHHCPFEGCEWSRKDSGDQLKHIMSEHRTEDMQEAVRLLGAVEREAAMYSVLNAGISMVCRCRVYIAQDRRSLRRYYEALYDKELQGLICFSCGCVHPSAGMVQEGTDIRI